MGSRSVYLDRSSFDVPYGMMHWLPVLGMVSFGASVQPGLLMVYGQVQPVLLPGPGGARLPPPAQPLRQCQPLPGQTCQKVTLIKITCNNLLLFFPFLNYKFILVLFCSFDLFLDFISWTLPHTSHVLQAVLPDVELRRAVQSGLPRPVHVPPPASVRRRPALRGLRGLTTLAPFVFM